MSVSLSENQSELTPALINQPPTESAQPTASWSALFVASLQGLWGRAPAWSHIPVAAPWQILLLFAFNESSAIFLEWILSPGPLEFYWRAALQSASYTLILCWLLYFVQFPHPQGTQVLKTLSILLLMTVWFQTVQSSIYRLIQLASESSFALSPPLVRIIYLVLTLWGLVVMLLLIWRSSARHKSRFIFAALALLGLTLAYMSGEASRYWYPKRTSNTEEEPKSLSLTQEIIEAQPVLLQTRLAEIRPQRAGVVDVFSIAFAPEASEDVFQREANMVSEVMQQRFDASGHSLQLINHTETLTQWPWATPLNLQRAIASIAQKMDRDEDLLFIYLTSHGGKDGKLAADFWPLEVDSVTPQNLKRWLDEAGIRHRVIVVSACYSGSWIAPLANPDSLIMTAADAQHTSYGCGRNSELTFFGRALFDEQLRTQTRSFTHAFEAARPLIKQREIKAGKDDGYSNPQISLGKNIRSKLDQLEARLK